MIVTEETFNKPSGPFNEEIHHEAMGSSMMPVMNAMMMRKAIERRSSIGRVPVKMHTDKLAWYYGTPSIEGVRPKSAKMPDKTLRALQEKNMVITLGIKTRIDQAVRYSKPSRNENQEGFYIELKDKNKEVTDADKKVFDEIEDFVVNLGDLTSEEKYLSGWDHKIDYRFKDFVSEYLWNLFPIDAAPVYLHRDKGDTLRGFFCIDGANILRVKEPGKTIIQGKKDIVYVEIVNEKIKSTFRYKDICYGYMNKRAEIKYAGYGYSVIEMAVDAVLGRIFGFDYNLAAFSKWKIPGGFLTISGGDGEDVDQETIDAVGRYWRAAMNGTDGQWSIPILPTSKDGAIEFKKVRDSNREMEYHKWMDSVDAFILAFLGVSPEEAGLSLMSAKKPAFSDEKNKMGSSKDRFRIILEHLSDTVTKIIQIRWPEYEFHFRGLDMPDKKAEGELVDQDLKTYRTLNDVLKEKGLEPLKGMMLNIGGKKIEAGDVPAPFRQEFQQLIQMGTQQQEGEGEYGEEPENGNDEQYGEADTEVEDNDNNKTNVDDDGLGGGAEPEPEDQAGPETGEGGAMEKAKTIKKPKTIKDFFVI